MKSATVTYLAILGGAIVWCCAFIAPPLFLVSGGVWTDVSAALYQFFHLICHQLDDRSFHIFGGELAVCIRCSAIYVAFAVGTVSYLFVSHRFRLILMRRDALLLALLPLVVDVCLDTFGIHTSTDISRIITGAFFGVVVPFVIIPVAEEGVRELVAASRLSPSRIKKGPLHA